MSFDKHTPASSPPPVFVSPALISMLLVVGVFLFATWQAFSTQKFAWLATIPGIPLAVFFLSRRDYFFLTIVIFTSANIWMPITGNDVPFHIYLRLIFVAGIIGAAIISRPPAARWDLPRISLICWTAIILMTMAVRGTGIRQLGSSLWGGKDYILLVAMILFLLVIPQSVRLTRKQWIAATVCIAFLPIIPLLADLLYIASGGRLYFLYYIFKPSAAVSETLTTLMDQDESWRLRGASRIDLLLILLLLLPRLGRTLHGKGIATILFFCAFILASFGGFRGSLIGLLGIAAIYAWLRARHRRMLMISVAALVGVSLMAFAHFAGPSLPSPAQRVLTIIPFARVNPIVRLDAEFSSRWRLRIWEEALRSEVRPHLLVGRGMCFDPNRLIPQFGRHVDEWVETQNYVTNGNFHSGPLSSLVSFGLPGFLCLLVFMISSVVKHLRIQRMEWHDPTLRHIHLVFTCYFVYFSVAFYLIYGDLSHFMVRYLSILCLLEMLGHTRREEVDDLQDAPAPSPLVTEPARARAIRYT